MTAPEPNSATTDIPPKSLRWWLTALQVRFRFVIIVIIAAVVVSQWRHVQSLWDRLTWTLTGAAGSTVAGGHEYFCPMDPGVRSVWPAICPICNMDLVPRLAADAQVLPEGVVARMQLSPYRLQLAGVRTSVVERRPLTCPLTYTGLVSLRKGGSSDAPDQATLPTVINSRDVELLRTPQPAILMPHIGSLPFKLQTIESPIIATAELLPSEPDEDSSGVRRLLLTPAGNEPLPVGKVVTVRIDVPFRNVADATASADDQPDDSSGVLAVPESAVIHRGDQHLVYVETMPGMFDGVAVTLGRRCGDLYPVLAGLQDGQKIATAGAFLIDAETRLNPNVAAGYFGANQAAESPLPTPADMTTIIPGDTQKKPPAILSVEDQAIVDAQKICPVTDLPLDSMGGPLPVMVGDRKVFICCAGCEKRLLDDPDKYLTKLAAAP